MIKNVKHFKLDFSIKSKLLDTYFKFVFSQNASSISYFTSNPKYFTALS